MEHLSDTFAALSDPTRRGIIACLARGEATVNELVSQFDLTQPTISAHLKVLEGAGLISRSRKAQTRPCRLRPEAFQELDVWLGRFRTLWEGNYQRLDALLDEIKTNETQGP